MQPFFILSSLLGLGRVLACSPSWYGTAPFCDGECPAGTRPLRTDKCGDGHCCATGHKVYCECIPNPGCGAFWSGTAPFCAPESCPAGWHEAGRSDWGDGGYCVTGKKILCECNGGGGPPCSPKPAVPHCKGIFLICDNGCSTFVCGGCFLF